MKWSERADLVAEWLRMAFRIRPACQNVDDYDLLIWHHLERFNDIQMVLELELDHEHRDQD